VPASSPLPAGVQAELAALVVAGEELRAGRHAENTRKAYLSDFAHFADWCAYRGLDALPAQPEAVWLYLTALVEADNAAGYRVATLERRLSAIKWVHEAHGHPTPTSHTRIRELMAGIRRKLGIRPDKVDPLFDDTRLAGERGVISVRLEAADEGRQALDEATRRLRPGLKIQSRLLTSLARAHLRQGDIDQACQLARDSLAVARASETESSLNDVIALRDELRPWEQSVAVQDLDAALSSGHSQ
jgi:hypothetical protein